MILLQMNKARDAGLEGLAEYPIPFFQPDCCQFQVFNNNAAVAPK